MPATTELEGVEQLAALLNAFGAAKFDILRRAAQRKAGQETAEVNPFSRGLLSAAHVPQERRVQPLWFGLYRRMITLLNGQTGAGKSSLLYNIALRAALGKPLYGVEFPSPLNVLYLDPENAGEYPEDGGICGEKIGKILGTRVPPPNLVFHDGANINLARPEQRESLLELLLSGCPDTNDQPFDLLVLDPYSALVARTEERSNAEGQSLMTGLTAMTRAANIATVLVHHTGHRALLEGTTNVLSGRGDTATAGSARVVLSFTAREGRGEEDDDTYQGEAIARKAVCRLKVEKDSAGHWGGSSLYLQMEGDDRFALSDFLTWCDAKPKGGK